VGRAGREAAKPMVSPVDREARLPSGKPLGRMAGKPDRQAALAPIAARLVAARRLVTGCVVAGRGRRSPGCWPSGRLVAGRLAAAPVRLVAPAWVVAARRPPGCRLPLTWSPIASPPLSTSRYKHAFMRSSNLNLNVQPSLMFQAMPNTTTISILSIHKN
jgi:hypothetical protein